MGQKSDEVRKRNDTFSKFRKRNAFDGSQQKFPCHSSVHMRLHHFIRAGNMTEKSHGNDAFLFYFFFCNLLTHALESRVEVLCRSVCGVSLEHDVNVLTAGVEILLLRSVESEVLGCKQT